MRADIKVDDKIEAIDQFLPWGERTFGDGTIAGIKKANGKLPYGIFASYVRSHAKLRKACGLSDGIKKDNKSYYSTMARYMTAIQVYFKRNSNVAKNVQNPRWRSKGQNQLWLRRVEFRGGGV